MAMGKLDFYINYCFQQAFSSDRDSSLWSKIIGLDTAIVAGQNSQNIIDIITKDEMS